MKAYEAVLKVFSKVVEVVTSILLIALVLIITWQVISRKLLGATPSWSEEISLIIVVWFGMLGAGLGIRDKSHLAVQFLVKAMPEGARAFFFRISYTLVLCFSVVMIVAGFRLYSFVMMHGEINPATKTPVGYTYLAIPISGIFIFMHTMKHIVDLYSGRYDYSGLSEESVAGEASPE